MDKKYIVVEYYQNDGMNIAGKFDNENSAYEYMKELYEDVLNHLANDGNEFLADIENHNIGDDYAFVVANINDYKEYYDWAIFEV